MSNDQLTDGMSNNDRNSSLKDKIKVFISDIELEKLDISALNHLKRAIDILEFSPTANPQVQNPWINVNVYRVLSVDVFAAEARNEYRLRHPYLPQILEGVRNVLILGPILVTWVELSVASAAYATRIISQPPIGVTDTFITLWERSFDGFAGSFGLHAWPLSTVAIIDAALIAIIVILTSIVALFVERWQHANEAKVINFVGRLNSIQMDIAEELIRQRGEYFEDAEQRSLLILREIDNYINEFRQQGSKIIATFLEQGRSDLAQIMRRGEELHAELKQQSLASQKEVNTTLSQISVEVQHQQDEHKRNMAELLGQGILSLTQIAQEGRDMNNQLANQSNELLNRLAAEQDRLAKWSTSMLDQMVLIKTISESFNSAVQTLGNLTPNLTSSLDNFTSSVSSLENETGQIRLNEERLADAVQNLEGYLSVFQDVVTVLGSKLADASTQVSSNIHDNTERLNQTEVLIGRLAATGDKLAEGETRLQESLSNERSANADWLDQLRGSVMQLSESQQAINHFVSSLEEFTRVISNTAADDRQLISQISLLSKTLADMQTEFGTYRENTAEQTDTMRKSEQSITLLSEHIIGLQEILSNIFSRLDAVSQTSARFVDEMVKTGEGLKSSIENAANGNHALSESLELTRQSNSQMIDRFTTRSDTVSQVATSLSETNKAITDANEALRNILNLMPSTQSVVIPKDGHSHTEQEEKTVLNQA